MNIDIHKAGGILLKDKKLLIEKSVNKSFFIAPGGSVEDGESVKQALVRELAEEFQIKVLEEDLEEFGVYIADAAGQEHRKVKMEVYLVNKWEGEPTPNMEVEQIRWINSEIPVDIKVGSIFEHEVIPELKKRGLID